METTELRTASDGEADEGRVGEILHRLADDVKTIARDELELARLEVEKSARTAMVEAAVVLLGGTVALIGLGLLCVSAVDALQPVVDPLWLRLIIMAAVFIALGSAVAAAFARRLRRDAAPDLDAVAGHAKQTVDSVKRTITRDDPAPAGGRNHHA